MQNPDFDRFVAETPHLLDLSLQVPCHCSLLHTPSMNTATAPHKRASRFNLKRILTFMRRRPSSRTAAGSFDNADVYPELEPPSPTWSTSASPYSNTAYSIYSDNDAYESYSNTSVESEDPFAKEGIQVVSMALQRENSLFKRPSRERSLYERPTHEKHLYDKPLPFLPSSSLISRRRTPLSAPPTGPLPDTPNNLTQRIEHCAPSAWLKNKSHPKSGSWSRRDGHHSRRSEISFLFPLPPSSTSSLYPHVSSHQSSVCSESPMSDEGDWLTLLELEVEDDASIDDGAFFTVRSSFS